MKVQLRWSLHDWWIGAHYVSVHHVVEVGLGPLGLLIGLPIKCDFCGVTSHHAPYCVKAAYPRRLG